jgi:hypothetical protein
LPVSAVLVSSSLVILAEHWSRLGVVVGSRALPGDQIGCELGRGRARLAPARVLLPSRPEAILTLRQPVFFTGVRLALSGLFEF